MGKGGWGASGIKGVIVSEGEVRSGAEDLVLGWMVVFRSRVMGSMRFSPGRGLRFEIERCTSLAMSGSKWGASEVCWGRSTSEASAATSGRDLSPFGTGLGLAVGSVGRGSVIDGKGTYSCPTGTSFPSWKSEPWASDEKVGSALHASGVLRQGSGGLSSLCHDISATS